MPVSPNLPPPYPAGPGKPTFTGAAHRTLSPTRGVPEHCHIVIAPLQISSLWRALLQVLPITILVSRHKPHLLLIMQDTLEHLPSLAFGRRSHATSKIVVSKPFSSPPLFHVSWCSTPCWADMSYTLEALNELVLACKPPAAPRRSCCAACARPHAYFFHQAQAGRKRRASRATIWFRPVGQGFN
jgi:hypothetical protein